MSSEQTSIGAGIAASGAYDAEHERLDLTPGMHARTVWHVVVALAVGVVVIALFNAQGFGKWAEKLPENAVSEFVIVNSFTWQDWMTALGTADIFAALRETFQAFREQVWHLWAAPLR